MSNKLPDHLGGHMNKVHTDRTTLLHLKEKYNIKSMIDIGCGPGDMVDIARSRGIDAVGVDGDFTLENHWKAHKIPVTLHDFTKGKAPLPFTYDLCWSVEFLEHIDEEYLPNVMETYKLCKYVVCTAAPPGHGGHHHVNCQPEEYWHDKFAEYGFKYNDNESANIRAISAMRKPFMQKTGMFYERID